MREIEVAAGKGFSFTIDLDEVIEVGPVSSYYDDYEVKLKSGKTYKLRNYQFPRRDFMKAWKGEGEDSGNAGPKTIFFGGGKS